MRWYPRMFICLSSTKLLTMWYKLASVSLLHCLTFNCSSLGNEDNASIPTSVMHLHFLRLSDLRFKHLMDSFLRVSSDMKHSSISKISISVQARVSISIPLSVMFLLRPHLSIFNFLQNKEIPLRARSVRDQQPEISIVVTCVVFERTFARPEE